MSIAAAPAATQTPLDLKKLSADLERALRLRNAPFAMKMFERRADMEAIEKIRRPKNIHTLDQVVGQAARLGWTVGITGDDLVGAQCRAVVGLSNSKTDDWRSGKATVGVWHGTIEDAAARQAALTCVPDGKFEALAVSPLGSGRLVDPDIALFYATPGAMGVVNWYSLAKALAATAPTNATPNKIRFILDFLFLPGGDRSGADGALHLASQKRRFHGKGVSA